jgi:hypothetical protein
MLKLFQKLDAYLRNSSLQEDNEVTVMDDDFWDLINQPQPWRTRIYWTIFRFFANTKIFHPKQIYQDIKWFIQRGRRGWANCDTWSLDSYLCGPTMLPAALLHLKKHKHGIPMSMFEDADGVDEMGNPTDAAHEKAEARWNSTIDQMIAGFEAAWRMQNALYEEELGDYPVHRPAEISREEWVKIKKERYAATRLLEARDQKIFEDGMKAFTIHFLSLWD